MGQSIRARAACLCAVMLMFAAGCKAPQQAPSRAYFGPTDPISVVVQDINAQVLKIPTLRAAGDFEATIVNDGRSQFLNGEVTLLYARPDKLRMIGNKPLAGRIFEIGTNGQRYWMIVRGETDTMWFGAYENVAQIERAQIPVRPDLLLEVLGVSEIEPDLMREPYPVMRFNNDHDAYMMTWNVKLPDRLVAQKEVWYDRQTRLPILVLLFDEHGRVLLRAQLAQHKPVEVPGIEREHWPKVATSYRLFFPDTGTKMSMNLGDVALQKNRAPGPNSFNFPAENEAGVSRIINVDEPPANE